MHPDSVIGSLLAVAVVAVLAPVVVALLPGPRIPQVVALLVGGMVIGSQGLHLAGAPTVETLADVGLGFLFLLAGYEIDQRLLAAAEGRRAGASWVVTLVLALAVAGLLEAVGLVTAFVPVAIALSTTALGTLVPILREHDLLRGRLGRNLLAAGAFGELLPIVAVAVFLGASNRYVALGSLAAVVAVAWLMTLLERTFRIGRVRAMIEHGQHETTQLTVRGTVLLLVLLLALTERLGLDAVLGAFLAGLVLRRWTRGHQPVLEQKLDTIGHGFFIPIFFVYSGMTMDLRGIVAAPLRTLLFVGVMLLVHAVPVFVLYRRRLELTERWQMALVTSTALPLVVAVTTIGLRNGTMLPENAAALVGASVLTVLLFPAVAVALRRAAPPADPGDVDGSAEDDGAAPPGRADAR